MAFTSLRRLGSRPARGSKNEEGLTRDRSKLVTSTETQPKLPSEYQDEYESLCKRWKDISHFMEELPKISSGTKTAGASAASARRDVQDGVKVCAQQLQSDFSLPFSLGVALNEVGALLEMVNDELFRGERDLPDSIARLGSHHLSTSFPIIKRAIDEAAKAKSHLQSCTAACEAASPSDYQRYYSACQAKYAAKHRFDCRLSSALELLASTLVSCETDAHKLLIQTHEGGADAMKGLKEKVEALATKTWDPMARTLEKRKVEYKQEVELEEAQFKREEQEEHEARFEPFIEVLCEGLAEGLLMVHDGDGRSVELISRILDAYDRGFPLMLEVIKNEVQTTSSPATLLRENNFASKMTIGYLKLITHDYISPITEIISQILCDPTAYEVDPQKMAEGADVDGNMARLIEASSSFLNTVVGSIDNAPKVLRDLLRCLYDGAEKKWPGKGYTAVGGFLFLRLICPALVFPEKNALMPDGEAPDANGRRGLMLVSKALQNLANGKKFREEYMGPLNEWFDSQLDTLRAYLERIIVTPAHAPTFNLATRDEVNEQDIPEVMALLVEHIEGVTQKMERNHKDAIPRSIAVLGSMTRWIDVENPVAAPKS